MILCIIKSCSVSASESILIYLIYYLAQPSVHIVSIWFAFIKIWILINFLNNNLLFWFDPPQLIRCQLNQAKSDLNKNDNSDLKRLQSQKQTKRVPLSKKYKAEERRLNLHKNNLQLKKIYFLWAVFCVWLLLINGVLLMFKSNQGIIYSKGIKEWVK